MAKSDTRRTKGQAKPRKERDPPGAVRKGEDAKTGGGGGESRSRNVDWCWPYNNPCAHPFSCWSSKSCYREQALGRPESKRPVGMETGANSGRPEREGAEAKGGEREADLFDCSTGGDISREFAKYLVPRRHYDRGLLRAKSLGVTGAAQAHFVSGYAIGVEEQNRETAHGAGRRTFATLLIGLTIGLLLPLAYQMVSRG